MITSNRTPLQRIAFAPILNLLQELVKMKTCDELTPIQMVRKYLSVYMAVVAADMDQMGDHELAEQLYDCSRAYELAMRGE